MGISTTPNVTTVTMTTTFLNCTEEAKKGNESVCGEETMHGCHCAKSWDYMQETYEECSNTKNFDRRWCKIVDGLSCDGSQKLPDGNYFDTCWEVQTGDETVNGCKCKSKWEYNGENITEVHQDWRSPETMVRCEAWLCKSPSGR